MIISDFPARATLRGSVLGCLAEAKRILDIPCVTNQTHINSFSASIEALQSQYTPLTLNQLIQG
jgi:hypothetical protein